MTDSTGGNATNASPRRSGRERLGLLVVAALALALRVAYVTVAVVAEPIRGDAQRYVFYAVNLLRHGIFSGTPIWLDPIVPDSFRPLGYPLLLAATIGATGESGSWYTLTLLVQAALGAATVVFLVLLARRWLSPRMALAAGVVFAVWPHHVVASGVLLTEVLFGFASSAALLALVVGQERTSRSWMAIAGAASGLAYLVNPIWLPIPLIAAAFLFWRRERALAVVLLAIFAIAPAGWAIRNGSLDGAETAGSRALDNLVQGSWPQFLPAFMTRFSDPISKSIVDAVDEERRLLGEHAREGIARIAERFADDPGYYARWYFFDKPYLLWAWDIRVGAGDVYVYPTTNSPYENVGVLFVLKRTLATLNAPIFLLALLGALAITATRRWRDANAFAPLLVAITFAYVCVVHTILQAEPRYSTPFRGEEIALAATALSFAAASIARRRTLKP